MKDLIEEKTYEGLLLFFNYFEICDISKQKMGYIKKVKIHYIFLDEQRSYVLIKETFSKTNLAYDYVFYGFDYLNANQIDLIKEMGNWTDVYIPIHQDIMCNLKQF